LHQNADHRQIRPFNFWNDRAMYCSNNSKSKWRSVRTCNSISTQHIQSQDPADRQQRSGQVLPPAAILSTPPSMQDDKFQSNLLNTIGVDFVPPPPLRRCAWSTAKANAWSSSSFLFLYAVGHRGSGTLPHDHQLLLPQRQRHHHRLRHHRSRQLRKRLQLVQRNEQVTEDRNRNIDQKVGCWIVGNKLDMSAKRVVSYEEGLALGSFDPIQPISTKCPSWKPAQRPAKTSMSFLKHWPHRSFDSIRAIPRPSNPDRPCRSPTRSSNTASAAIDMIHYHHHINLIEDWCHSFPTLSACFLQLYISATSQWSYSLPLLAVWLYHFRITLGKCMCWTVRDIGKPNILSTANKQSRSCSTHRQKFCFEGHPSCRKNK